MKYGQVAVALAQLQLIGVAVAQPHRHHVHKRAIITATIWETQTAPDVVVYVDENGRVISTGGGMTPPTPAPQPAAPPAQAPPAPPAPAPAPAPPVVKPAPPSAKPASSAIKSAPSAPTPPAPAPPAPASPAPAPPAAAPAPAVVANLMPVAQAGQSQNSAQEQGADTGAIDQGLPASYGVTWTGYKGDEQSSQCKTFEDADREWSSMSAFSIVRVYGTDCDQPNNAMILAKKYNKKLFLGVYNIGPTELPGGVHQIISAARANNGWSLIDTISIGNEDVNRGAHSAEGVIVAVNAARAMLRPSGYRGPIVHVDTQNAILANPKLCGHLAGDYIAANIHAFFNPNTPAENAGDFVAGQVDALRQCGATSWKRRSVRVRVTETGWPKDGYANGAAVPSKQNQVAAISSIKRKLGNDVFLFSAFNNYWMKNDAGTFNTEHYWGIFDS